MAINLSRQGGFLKLNDNGNIKYFNLNSFYYNDITPIDGDFLMFPDGNKYDYNTISSPVFASAEALADEIAKYKGESNSGTEGTISNFVYVSSKADLPTAIGGAITLLDEYTYFFTRDVDLTGDRLVSGQDTVLLGASSENATISSTGLGAVALLTSTKTMPVRHITFTADLVLDIDASDVGAYDWTGVNFLDCADIGTIKNVTNFIFTKGAFLNSNGLKFDGNVGTIAFNSSIFVGQSTGTAISILATAVISRRFRIIYSSFVTFGSAVSINVDVSASVPIEGYILDTINFSGGGTYIQGVDNTSNLTRWTDCKGVINTAVNGQIYMTDNATTTVIADTTTFVKVLGATTSSLVNEKYIATSGRLTNNAVIERKFLIQCNLAFTTGNNKVCEFAFYDSKLGAIRVPSQTKSTSNAGGRAENVSMSCVVSHSLDDYLEIFTRNTTDTTDVTVTDMNFVITEIN